MKSGPTSDMDSDEDEIPEDFDDFQKWLDQEVTSGDKSSAPPAEVEKKAPAEPAKAPETQTCQLCKKDLGTCHLTMIIYVVSVSPENNHIGKLLIFGTT